MIRKLIKISVFFVLIGLWSCKDYLDINHDPNVLGDIPNSQVLLPTAEVNIANTLMGWELGISGAFWSQYWTQEPNHSQFKFLCNYDNTSHGTAYNNLTSGVLNDLKKIGKMAKEKSQPDLAFIAEVLEIFTWQTVTDIWGDVPYFQALKGNEGIKEPVYDKGEEIYKDLNKRIDALLALTLPEESTFDKKYDFIYGGDMELWKHFANSLKIKLMLRVSETPGYDNNALLTFIESVKTNGLLEKNAQIDKKYWEDGKEGKRHPMREFEAGKASYLSNNVIACKTFFDYLTKNGDPRFKEGIFEREKQKAAFYGDYSSLEDSDEDGTVDKDETYAIPGFAPSKDNIARMDKFLNLVLMSTWEVNFYVAEVYQRAGNNTAAKEYYEKGVTASMTTYGIKDTDIDFTGAYLKWDDAKGLEQIAMQKWVAYANFQHYESFLERNRLKIPKIWNRDIKLDRQGATKDYPSHIGEFTISVEGRGTLNGLLPASALYPQFVLARNANSPSQKVNLSTKVWWDKKADIIVN